MPARKTPRPALGTPAQRFRHAQQELHQLDYFLKGTVSKRMMKCGQPQCACHRDPSQRHGPYFERTYKVKGKTINVKLSAQAAPLYLAATKQNRKLPQVGLSVFNKEPILLMNEHVTSVPAVDDPNGHALLFMLPLAAAL